MNGLKKHGRFLSVAVFVCLFTVLLIIGILMIVSPENKRGPMSVLPMQPETVSVRTGAMLDPNREVRGIWVPSVMNITFPSAPGLSAEQMRTELDEIVRVARDANLNTVCLQVRPCADALYDSNLFPSSAYLSGTQGEAADEEFDPLAYLCEIARSTDEEETLAVYAWINPLRVTVSGQSLDTLSSDNPAALHPEWTFTYKNAVYFDVGIPEVRALVAAGVEEICENYPVSGVIFDDYFYPYPVVDENGEVLSIDDTGTYEKYGLTSASIADFRRESVNAMIELCYNTVKGVSDYIRFGVAPFGIWQNDDGTNGGSDTGGMEAYDAIYCDAIAWMKGGYIDFLAPQIYWQFSTKVARYDTLVRFWNAQCDAYGTDLLISHAIYDYENWSNPNEMRNQIVFARAEISYRGSLFYGYPQLKENTLGVTDEIRSVCEENILYYEKEAVTDQTTSFITLNLPKNNTRFDEDGTFLMGQSDPQDPLYCDGQPVSRTRSGYFTFYRTLDAGENTFVFEQNGETYLHTVWKGRYPPQDPGDTTTDRETRTEEPIRLELYSPQPAVLTAIPWDEGLEISVTATEGAAVSAVIGDKQVSLKKVETLKDGMAVYKTTVSLPQTADGTVLDCGVVRFSAVYGTESVHLDGASIYAVGHQTQIPVRVEENGTSLKVSPTSWYYDDYIPVSAGMRTLAKEIRNGFALITIGDADAYLDAASISVDMQTVNAASVGVPTVDRVTPEETRIRIPSTGTPPVHCVKENTAFSVILYQSRCTSDTDKAVTLIQNPLFENAVTLSQRGEQMTSAVTYTFSLLERDRFYGFTVSYEEGAVIITLRNPRGVDLEGEKPLLGKRIVLDAGHGGTDTGTATPGSHLGQKEKDCNLAIVLLTAEMLEKLGAEVILLRSDDTTLDIYTRMDMIDEICPDLLVSVHQNAMSQGTDISHIRGVVGLYWTESGRSLADCIAEQIADALGRYKRDTTKQRLAMLRNYKFPAALVEIGFVTYPEEFEVLMAPDGYEKTARAICDGILAWYATQE